MTLSVVLGFVLVMAPSRWPTTFCRSQMRQARRDIAAVDSFRVKYNRLADTLSEAGVSESDPESVFYQNQEKDKYIIWFGTTLGESATYESSTKQWH
jgi:hypothetical protein